MDDFLEDDPLDLDGDGDHIVEMCMLFDDNEELENRSGNPPPQAGCLGLLLFLALPQGAFLLLRPFLA